MEAEGLAMGFQKTRLQQYPELTIDDLVNGGEVSELSFSEAIPFCVVVGWIMREPMDLNFQLFETVAPFITCGAPRRDCRHTRTSPRGRITCSCGRKTATVLCDTGGNNNTSGFNVDTSLEAFAIQKLHAPLQPAETNGKRTPLGHRKLYMTIIAQYWNIKRILQMLFGVNTSLEALHFGESSAVSDMIADLFRRDPKWVLSVEKRCKMLVLGRVRYLDVLSDVEREERCSETYCREMETVRTRCPHAPAHEGEQKHPTENDTSSNPKPSHDENVYEPEAMETVNSSLPI